MLILGLNAFHPDSAACLIRDGRLVAAAEEERFRRVKHWAGLPTEAIKYCLAEAQADFGEIDHIAVNRKPGANHWRRLQFLLRHRPSLKLVTKRVSNLRAALSVQERLGRAFAEKNCRAKMHFVEHHLAHLASAYLISPFQEAVCLSVDGFGDFASVAWGMGRKGAVVIDGRVHFPHSLGIFYSAITQYLGFPRFGDEYKVMGLAPYGEPRYIQQMRQLVRVQCDGTFRLDLSYFRHHRENVPYTWNECAPEVGSLYTSKLEHLFGPPRTSDQSLEQKHRDIACSAQVMYEEAFFTLLQTLHAKYQCTNLALAGGCALNSVANGKIRVRSPFRRLFVPAAAGDAGGALGAALVVWREVRSLVIGNQLSVIRGRRSEVRGQRAEIRDQRTEIGCQSAERGGLRRDDGGSRETINGHLQFLHRGLIPSCAYTGPQFDDAAIERLLRARGLLTEDSACVGVALPSAEHRVKIVEPSYSSTDSAAAYSLQTKLHTEHQVSNIQYPASGQHSSPEFLVVYFVDQNRLCRSAAEAISEGRIVGWFQGRMEWGPRALGNRSILGDPRRANMKEILNDRIKRRESFRPFAPSILRENVADWFEQEEDVPFMTEVFKVRKDKRVLVPAITHVDGSARLQTVHREENPLYWRLISEFCALTSVPMVLNTSFNENEPIVCRPEEALDCFLRTSMDVLVMGAFMICRNEVAFGR